MGIITVAAMEATKNSKVWALLVKAKTRLVRESPAKSIIPRRADIRFRFFIRFVPLHKMISIIITQE